MTAPPPTNDDTPPLLIVKPLKSDDRLLKQSFKMQLQGEVLLGFREALSDRNETPAQLIQDLLEEFLIREKYLPEWWLTRKKPRVSRLYRRRKS